VRALNGRLVVVKRQTDVTEGEVGDTGSLTPQPQMAEPVLERRSGVEVSCHPGPQGILPGARIRDLTVFAAPVIARA
jgi:hypothetical protein